jgi:tetratricopeptide (TPR) repeat protein
VAGDAGVELRAKLANVLWRTGRRGQAREAFHQALRLARAEDTLRRAHLHTRLGRLEMADLRHEAAARAFDAAEALLGQESRGKGPGLLAEWLEMMVDGRAALHAMRNEPEAALATLEAARPALEASGSPARKFSYYMYLAFARVVRNDYRVDQADIATMRESLAAAAQGDEEKDVGYATVFLGLLEWLHGDLDAAREHTERSLAMAERIGESILLGQSLLGLALLALRRRDTEAVRALMPPVMAVAEAMASYEYLAGAKSCLAWLAWQDRRQDDVLQLSDEIAELMATDDPGTCQGLVYLWPLIAVHLDAGHLAGAVAAGRLLLRAPRPALPHDIKSAVQAASTAWDQGQPEVSGDKLAAALALAVDRYYF